MNFFYRITRKHLLLLSVFLTSQVAGQVDPKLITIARDSFGVPHIFAKTDPQVAYGLAWAHAEDDFRSLQLMALPSKGLMGRVLGKNGAAADFAFAFYRCREITDAKWHTLSPDFLRLIEGYVQGLNDYARSHKKEILHKSLFPVNVRDYIASSVLALTNFNGGGRALASIFNNGVEPPSDADKKGSNAIAVHPTRTNTGEAFLAINAHQPNEGPEAFYEAHVCSEDNWNVLGGLLAGGPCILHGVNENLGWAHTVNLCDRLDMFRLEMNPTDKDQYLFDGEWQKLEKKSIKLRIKGVPVPVKRELLWSKYGATMRNKQGVYSVRLGANMEIRPLEQWYRMNKARNFTEFYKAISMQGLSMFNIMYADRNDTIFYINNALMPVRDSSTRFNWKGTLPGNTKQTLWEKFRGIGELPQYVNPSSGFLFNTNHSSFLATSSNDNLSSGKFPLADGWETNHNNRSVRFLELMPEEGKLSFEQFSRMKFDRQFPARFQFPVNIDTLFMLDPAAYPGNDTIINNLRQWDRRGDADSKGAAVFSMVYDQVTKQMRNRSISILTRSDCEALIISIGKEMREQFGKTDLRLGDIQKLVRGEMTFPASGLPDLLAPEYGTPIKNGIRKITGGDAYVALVRFRKDGLPIIETSNTYGASSKKESPHFADQVPLFLEQKTKRMTLDKAEVLRTAVRTYHPGE